MSLRHRAALVTGGTRGIGKGLATSLGREGARLAIAYRSNKAAAQNTLRQLQAEARRVRDARCPIGRPPTADDVAAAVKFFASEEADYVTGQVVHVSGGWLL